AWQGQGAFTQERPIRFNWARDFGNASRIADAGHDRGPRIYHGWIDSRDCTRPLRRTFRVGTGLAPSPAIRQKIGSASKDAASRGTTGESDAPSASRRLLQLGARDSHLRVNRIQIGLHA